MTFAGRELPIYQIVLFAVFACVALSCSVYHMLHLERLKILATKLLPLLYISLAVDNAIMALGDVISPTSPAAYVAYGMHALHIPLFLVFFNEIGYHMHKVRGVQYFLLEFNEETMESDKRIGSFIIASIRILALGLLALTVLTNFDLLSAHPAPTKSGGYIYLARNISSVSVWLSLIPPIALTIISFIVSYMVWK